MNVILFDDLEKDIFGSALRDPSNPIYEDDEYLSPEMELNFEDIIEHQQMFDHMLD